MINSRKRKIRKKYKSTLKYFLKKNKKLYENIEDNSDLYDKPMFKKCINLLEELYIVVSEIDVETFYRNYKEGVMISEHIMKLLQEPSHETIVYNRMLNKLNSLPEDIKQKVTISKRDLLIDSLFTD